jgi:hypothetical protein
MRALSLLCSSCVPLLRRQFQICDSRPSLTPPRMQHIINTSARARLSPWFGFRWIDSLNIRTCQFKGGYLSGGAHAVFWTYRPSHPLASANQPGCMSSHAWKLQRTTEAETESFGQARKRFCNSSCRERESCRGPSEGYSHKSGSGAGLTLQKRDMPQNLGEQVGPLAPVGLTGGRTSREAGEHQARMEGSLRKECFKSASKFCKAPV